MVVVTEAMVIEAVAPTVAAQEAMEAAAAEASEAVFDACSTALVGLQ